MRKRLLIFAAGLVAILFAGYIVLWLTAPRPHRITAESVAKIEESMTPAEVEAVIGVRAGDHSRVPQGYAVRHQHLLGYMHPDVQPNTRWWFADDFAIVVTTDDQGRTVRADGYARTPGAETILDRLRRWLGIKR